MALVKWTPFIEPAGDDFDNFFDRLAGRSSALSQGFTPALDVYEDKNNVIVETPLAGVEPEKVDISVENDVLTISGNTEKKSEVEEKNYYRKEVRSGGFYRAVQLPAKVLGEKAEATYDKGVLTISIPKAPEARPKSIKIKPVKKK